MPDPSLSSPNNEDQLATQTSAKSLPKPSSQRALHKTLASASNLANLLPTGTVLSFQALIPSFSNNGSCRLYNKYLASSLVGLCAVVCYLSSFTDSFRGKDGKLYYGVAALRGFYVFDYRDCEGDVQNDAEMTKLRISFVDTVHALVSLSVFLIFAFSNPNVWSCFFPEAGTAGRELMINLPIGAGIVSTFLFIIFPTRRRRIGYTDLPPRTN